MGASAPIIVLERIRFNMEMGALFHSVCLSIVDVFMENHEKLPDAPGLRPAPTGAGLAQGGIHESYETGFLPG
jgi:hypothetical protein